MIRLKQLFTLSFIILFATVSFAQNRMAGIEIGGKGVKLVVADIVDAQKGKFKKVTEKQINTALSKSIANDGKMGRTDIEKSASATQELISTAKEDFAVKEEKIYVFGSSGVGVANNTEELRAQVKTVAKKDMEFITAAKEGKLSLKTAIPIDLYNLSVMIDIGGSNTKGGYVLKDGNSYDFHPIDMNWASVTTTERVRRNAGKSDFNSFKDALYIFADTIRMEAKSMVDNEPASRFKKNIYMVGGAAFCFISIMKPDANDDFTVFKYADILNYKSQLENNWDAIQNSTNPAIQKALTIYSRENLLAGALVMKITVEELGNPDTKTMVFSRQGYWVIGALVDKARQMDGSY